MHAISTVDNKLIIDGETHQFSTVEAAEKRAAFIAEALTWVGTPFIDCADIKGRNGGIDCAMLMVRSSVDLGLLPWFDPRPYPPRWHLHQDRERFLEIVEGQLGARETDNPRVGDAVIYRVGRCFAHGTIVINSSEVVHAWYSAGMCLTSLMREPALDEIYWRGVTMKRPRKAFDLWGG